MTARTHDAAAFTALTLAVLAHPPGPITLSTAILTVLANLIGGVMPDIDQPTAPLWRNLPIGKYFGRIFDDFTGGHRFLTHSIIGLAVFGFLAKLLLTFLHPIMPHVNSGYVWWAFMIGMISHLAMDTLTKEGVPWLLPLPWKIGLPPFKRLRITTGKKLETYVVLPGLLICWLALVYANYHEVLNILHQIR